MKYMRVRKIIECVCVIVITVVMVGFRDAPLLINFELKLFDFFSSLRRKSEPDEHVVIVAADDTSIAHLGRWPWPRSYYATALNLLYYFEPAVVGYDLLFSEPDLQNPQDDDLFAELIAATGMVCLSYYFDFQPDVGTRFDQHVLPDTATINRMDSDSSGLLSAHDVVLPISKFSSTAQLGFINAPRGTGLLPDYDASSDGILRDIPLVIHYENKVYPSFALQMACSFLGATMDDVSVRPGSYVEIRRKDDDPLKIPIDEHGKMTINYRGGLESFHTIAFEHLLQAAYDLNEGRTPQCDPELFRSRIVLIGITATGIDVGELPLAERVAPLCLVHANALYTILSESFIRRIWSAWWVWGATALIIFLTGWFAIQLPAALSLMLFMILMCLLGALFTVLFFFGIWIPSVPVTLGSVLSFFSVNAMNLINEEREKRRIKKMFGHYVSKNILDELVQNPDMLKLGGENKELTVLFSDIRGFTTYCENKTPEEVVSILNEYLDAMTEVVIEHGGTLDKYVGDEIMAIFGAPGDLLAQTHAIQAVKTACAMIERLAVLHETWASEGREPFYIGIGINTGLMKVGNMGSRQLFDYTVIGDEVNAGARIEALTRDYNVDIIISENTYNRVKTDIDCTLLGQTQVKGKSKPVTIYAVHGVRKYE